MIRWLLLFLVQAFLVCVIRSFVLAPSTHRHTSVHIYPSSMNKDYRIEKTAPVNSEIDDNNCEKTWTHTQKQSLHHARTTEDAMFPSALPILDMISRRRTIGRIVAATTSSVLGVAVTTEKVAALLSKPMVMDGDELVEIPLEYIPTLDAYVVRYQLFGEDFAAIIDTGSPFLTVPSYCKPYRNLKMKWGCYRPELTMNSGYTNTIEGFDNNYGTVVWRKANFAFLHDNNNNNYTTTPIVFGVLDKNLLNGPGGVFFGLIKETDRWIRPSFLGQTGYNSFCVDLRHNDDNRPKLILSRQPLIGSKTDIYGGDISRSIPLVRDLRSRYGDPVLHYTAKATKLVVNGQPLCIDQRKKPLYVIFDTGVSGMVVSQTLFDDRYLQARKNREKSVWGSVEVAFLAENGEEVVLSAKNNPITTPLGKSVPWKGFRGNLIVVGIAFLDGLSTTVNINEGKILFHQ